MRHIASLVFIVLAVVNSFSQQQSSSLHYQRWYFVDTTNVIELAQISSDNFIKINTEGIDLVPSKTYWFKYIVVADKPYDVGCWIISARQYRQLEFYIKNKAGELCKQQAGIGFPYRQWTFKLNNIMFIASVSDTLECYMKATVSDFFPDGGRFGLRNIDKYFEQLYSDLLYFGFFYGLALLAALYAFIFYIRMREKAFLFYSLYVFCLILFAAVAWGQILIPLSYLGWNWSNDYYTIPFASMIIFLMLYARSFLNTKKNLPIFDKIIISAIILRVIIYFAGLIFSIRYFYSPYIDNILLSSAFIAALILWHRGHRYARYLVLAFTVLFTGLIIHSTRYLLTNKSLPNILSLYHTGMIEIILFSFALADRFKSLKDEKQKSQEATIRALQENQQIKDHLNIELERKVRERTEELEIAGKKIEEMNNLLILDNKKLTSDVKQVSQKRVMQNVVTFDEFKVIYPDDETCYHYLINKKWERGFVCRNCTNDKYSIGPSPYSRRCSKCNHIESVTAGTVFENLKFPIHKAFYILFLVCSGKSLSVDEMSETLQLRRQTCWSFRKKVELILEEYSIKKKKIIWADIIIVKDKNEK